jgi:EAL domain-containing protein (putative c-di-GMP-specific phosphodiesterase class I)
MFSLILLAFRLSRPLRAMQRPRYISFYQPKVDTPEIIVPMEEVKQWLKKKATNIFTQNPIPLKNQQWCVVLFLRIISLQNCFAWFFFT